MIDNKNELTSRYRQAQTLHQALGTKSLVQNDTLFPHWIGNTDCFWYERTTKQGREPTTKIGKEFRLVDAKAATNTIAFDHNALAIALEQVSDQSVDHENLPVSYVAINLSTATPSVVSVSFVAFDQHWKFSSKNNRCQAIESPIVKVDEAISPDGKRIAFVRDYNLWLRDVASGEEQAVTFDGEEDYAYGGCHNAWGSPSLPEAPSLWSPDSIRLLFVLRDKRQVLTLPMVDHVPADGSVRPVLQFTKVAYPGDDQVETYRLLALDTASGKTCAPNYHPITAGLNNNMGLFFARMAWWANDNRHAYFIDQERGDRVVRLVGFDTHTGNTQVLFEEVSDTYINIMTSDGLSPPAHRILTNSNELIWWSERSGWGHLYLYDLTSGELKNPITLTNPSAQGSHNWSVREVLHVDEEHREILIQTSGRVLGRNPYYRDICRVNIDTGEIITIFSSDEDITVHYPESWIVQCEANFINRVNTPTSGLSPNGNYIVLTRSRVDQPPAHELLCRDGKKVMEVETTNISSLPKGWTWPEPVEVMAADGITPLYGV